MGYINRAFSTLSVAPPGSLVDYNLDRLSHKSSGWGEDDDDDDGSLAWLEGNMPDSGLHSVTVSTSM